MSELHVEIETTNQCNTRCLHCPHESVTRPMGKMAWDTFRTVTDKIFACYANVSIEFAGMGEPLLNPLVYQFIGYVSERAKTSLTTNASALTPQNIERLIKVGLDRCTISFNGTDKESYELMMGGLNFERAAAHLRSATEMSRGTRMEVAANVSVTKQTQSKLVEIKDYLNHVGIETIFFSKCHNRGGHFNNPFVCDTLMPSPSDKPRCDIFTNTLFVAWNGDVLSCCHDLAGTNELGNLISNQLEEILRLRQGIAEKGVSFEICRECNDIYRYMNDHLCGISLSDWVYTLYTPETTLPPCPDMLRWVYAVYAQENQSEYFIQRMWARQAGLQQQVDQLAQKNVALLQTQYQLAEKEAALYEIKSSIAWKVVTIIRKIRVWLLPKDSHRECLAKKVWHGVKKLGKRNNL